MSYPDDSPEFQRLYRETVTGRVEELSLELSKLWCEICRLIFERV